MGVGPRVRSGATATRTPGMNTYPLTWEAYNTKLDFSFLETDGHSNDDKVIAFLTSHRCCVVPTGNSVEYLQMGLLSRGT